MQLPLEDDAGAFAQPCKCNSATALELNHFNVCGSDLDPAQNQHTAGADSTTVLHLTHTAFFRLAPRTRQLCYFLCRHRTSTVAATSASAQLKLLFCKNRREKKSFQFQEPLIVAWRSTILLSFSVWRPGVLCTYLFRQPLPFFFFSKANQGQLVLLSVFTERLMTHVQATIFLSPLPLRSTVVCTFNKERQGDRRQQPPGFRCRKTKLKQSHRCCGEKIKPRCWNVRHFTRHAT